MSVVFELSVMFFSGYSSGSSLVAKLCPTIVTPQTI